jgi:hypothetical protein
MIVPIFADDDTLNQHGMHAYSLLDMSLFMSDVFVKSSHRYVMILQLSRERVFSMDSLVLGLFEN